MKLFVSSSKYLSVHNSFENFEDTNVTVEYPQIIDGVSVSDYEKCIDANNTVYTMIDNSTTLEPGIYYARIIFVKDGFEDIITNYITVRIGV